MIILGLGSNLSSSYGDRFQNIDMAVSALEGYGLKVQKKSNYYESLSYPNKKNPKYILIDKKINKKNNDTLLSVLGSKDDKKIIIKNEEIAKTKCLLKKRDDSFREKDNIIPTIKRIEISIKLILSISFHHNCKLKKLFMIDFFY